MEIHTFGSSDIKPKYFLLVDDISTNENYGFVSDIKKIKKNVDVFGEFFKNELSVYRLIHNYEGTTTVFSLGRFIIVFSLSEDGKEGSMTFFDFQINKTRQELKTILLYDFSETITCEFLKLYDVLLASFSKSQDVFFLQCP